MTTSEQTDPPPQNHTRSPLKLALAMGVAAVVLVGIVIVRHVTHDNVRMLGQDKIQQALAAGPASITKDATAAESDGHGGMTVLRPGSAIFPACPKVISSRLCARTE